MIRVPESFSPCPDFLPNSDNSPPRGLGSKPFWVCVALFCLRPGIWLPQNLSHYYYTSLTSQYSYSPSPSPSLPPTLPLSTRSLPSLGAERDLSYSVPLPPPTHQPLASLSPSFLFLSSPYSSPCSSYSTSYSSPYSSYYYSSPILLLLLLVPCSSR